MNYEIALALYRNPPVHYRTFVLLHVSQLLFRYSMDSGDVATLIPDDFMDVPWFEVEANSRRRKIVQTYYKTDMGFFCPNRDEHCMSCYPDEDASYAGFYLACCAEGLERECMAVHVEALAA